MQKDSRLQTWVKIQCNEFKQPKHDQELRITFETQLILLSKKQLRQELPHVMPYLDLYLFPLTASLLTVRIRIDLLNRSVFVVFQLGIFNAPLVVDPFRQGAVVIEQIPLVFNLHNGVVCCPADNRR